MDSKKIRINSGIVIEVNDNGESITMNADDQMFIDKFMRLIEKLEVLTKQLEGMNEKGEREQLDTLVGGTREIMEDMDRMFGENTCKKVFGDIVPSPYLIGEFFDQLIPIAETYMDERQKEIAKRYSRKRKGGRRG